MRYIRKIITFPFIRNKEKYSVFLAQRKRVIMNQTRGFYMIPPSGPPPPYDYYTAFLLAGSAFFMYRLLRNKG